MKKNHTFSVHSAYLCTESLYSSKKMQPTIVGGVGRAKDHNSHFFFFQQRHFYATHTGWDLTREHSPMILYMCGTTVKSIF